MSLVGCRASFGRTNFWSAERTCTALAFQAFRRAAACAVGDIHYLGHSYRAYADLFTRALSLLTVSVAPWRGIAPRLCPTLINATSSDAVLLVRRHSYGDYTEWACALAN